MPIIVNGAEIPEELIRQETERLNRDPRWNQVADPAERAWRVRQAGEHSAINRMLLEHAAATDKRPIDPALMETEVQRQKTAGGCRNAFDDTLLRQHTERQLRIGRIVQELTANAAKSAADEIEGFYESNRDNFRRRDSFHAAHIVLHVNETRNEENAEAGIHIALAELEAGEDFGAVAERHSDCKGNGGDLGNFEGGVMVAEFEDALRSIEPGRRTGVFTTPFGFHIAKLHSLTPGGPSPFEDVREDVERVLTAMAEHREYLNGVEELRQRATITRTPDVQPGAQKVA
jgi:peptidyl-prolyl cis-trans isomerase C